MPYRYSDAEVEGIIKMRDELAERGTRLEKENREVKANIKKCHDD